MSFKWLEFIKAEPMACDMISDPGEVDKKYRYWRTRQMYSTFIGYAAYYFVRQNMSMAMPLMEAAMGIGKDKLGLFLTLHKLLYGASKFVNGMLGDRSNPRYFMVIGLVLSAVVNIFFGFSNAVIVMGVLWMLNGWFQGMGYPPCARILSYWFSKCERGTTWSIWNASHQVGAGIILIMAGYLSKGIVDWHIGGFHLYLDSWQLCFIVPALIVLAVALFLWNRLRDTPGSMGLPPVEVYKNDEPEKAADDRQMEGAEFTKFLKEKVFANKYVWYISFANFFVYILRYGFLDWAPSCLLEMKGIALQTGGWLTAGFELLGLVGSVFAGILTDRYFKNNRAIVCVAYMLITTGLVYWFWKLPAGLLFPTTLSLFLLGFFIYGPQFLVGVMTCDLTSKKAVGTAIGLTGLFGYLSGIVSGYGLGLTVKLYGWDGSFVVMLFSAVAAAGFFALCLNAKPVADKEETAAGQ